MKKFILFSILLVACSSVRTTYKEYNVVDKQHVLDSIKNSGTTVSVMNTRVLTLDDGKKDTVQYATLIRKGKIEGSVQIRKKDEVNNIIIIDRVKK